MKRLSTGEYRAPDHPTFLPNLSPTEMFSLGIFGGTYFRDITLDGKTWHRDAWREFNPYGFFQGLNIPTQVASQHYAVNMNRYRVKCGQDLETWIAKGWIKKEFDTHGWVHWYCRFFLGRRCADDARQIARWSACAGNKGRWKRNLIAKCVKAGKPFDDETVSPIVRQLLLHWGYQLTQPHFQEYKKLIEGGHKTSFIPRHQMAHVVKVPVEPSEQDLREANEAENKKRIQDQNEQRERRRLKRARP